MMKVRTGFVLVTTLLTIFVISLLLLSSMQQLLLFHKTMNRLELRHQDFYQLEQIALHLANIPSAQWNKKCIEKGDAANLVIRNLQAGKGCFFKSSGKEYVYLIEELGIFACWIVTVNEKKTGSKHYRLTVLNKEDELALRLRIITPIDNEPCLGEMHFIPHGVTSWHFS